MQEYIRENHPLLICDGFTFSIENDEIPLEVKDRCLKIWEEYVKLFDTLLGHKLPLAIVFGEITPYLVKKDLKVGFGVIKKDWTGHMTIKLA